MVTSYCKNNHILVGLGGTGGKILRAFKMRMFEEFPDEADRSKQPVALLYVDSTDEMMGIGRPDFRVMGMDASFTQKEFLNIKEVDVNYILDHIDSYPSVKGIVSNVTAVKTAIGSLGKAAGQKRRAGRILFAANAIAYVNALKDAYARCEAISHNTEKTNIHIFAGLAGGTGSGSIIDAIVQTRKAFPEAIISVYAMIPEMNLPKSDMDQGRYYPNGYAAMNELNGLQAGRFTPHDVTGSGNAARLFSEAVKGVANGLTIYSNVNENGLTVNSLTDLPRIVSDFAYARVFLIDSNDSVNDDIIRAYDYENMDDFAVEYDEMASATETGKPIARTKKINSFGIKRVVYPELRVLKHITYSTGERILYQFKYNNWKENLGYIDEEANKDYRALYFNDVNLAKWMLDDAHLMLEDKIFESDKDYPKFQDYWHDKAINYSEEAKQADNPLTELDDILADFFEGQFRECGVMEYFKGKEKAIPDLSKEIRRTIEHELFNKWKVGDISIVELQRVSRLLIETVSDIRKKIDNRVQKESEELVVITQERDDNVAEWAHQGFLKKNLFGGGTNAFTNHQDILTDYYTCRTRMAAWEFAKKLATRLFIDVSKLDEDISAFGQKINDALTETEKLIAGQKKVNRGLEDMKSVIIEVSEDEVMEDFEDELKMDRTDMPNIARQLREFILPEKDFTTFGTLADSITIDDVCNAFDVKLSAIIKTKHEERVANEKKVLGLNILTQLRQKLTTDLEIQQFALDIMTQSGVFLRLNNDQMQLHVRNNEGNLSPTNPASINKKTILISIPSPEDDTNLSGFARKLEMAFKNSIPHGNAQCSITVNNRSPRKDELTIVTVSYCYPMRCISWLASYKETYEAFLHTGNVSTDSSNAILLHGEGNGAELPSIFVVEGQQDKAIVKDNIPPLVPPVAPNQMPNPDIQVFIAVAGSQYGPFDYETCRTMVENKRLTEHSLVWMQGMAAWTPAGQVPQLASLFVSNLPPIPPAMDGFPPVPPTL